MIPTTKRLRETIQEHVRHDPLFRRGLLTEAIECFLCDEIQEGKLILRDYVNATVGFEELARLTDKTPKSLMRMLSADGNPRADNLFTIIGQLQAREGVRLSVHAQ